MRTDIKVLVIGNECFSNSNSNGRTLKNFFIGWPKENLAQFYIHDCVPDKSVCDNYFQVSDKQALNAFLGRKNSDDGAKDTSLPNARTTQGRNAFTMLVRTVIWNSNRWKKYGFDKWVDSFSPDLIVVQVGDSPFTLRLSRKTAKKRRIPIVLYNSENFYFKKYDYFRATGFPHLLYPLFRKVYRSELKAIIKSAEKSVYICEPLERDYKAIFNKPSETIYTATEMTALDNAKHDGFTVSYLGNMGVGRHRPLIEVGEALQSISENYYLDVYGSVPNSDIEKQLKACRGIRLHGFVTYDEVIQVMKNSDVLLHVEDFEPFYREGLKRAFSTKVADTLASGKCFLLYAPEEIACVDYVRKNDVAFTVTEKSELKNMLKALAESPEKREQYREKALELVRKNHDSEKNAQAFQSVIINAYESFNKKLGD